MALTRHAIRLIAPFLRGARVVSLGYPDLLVRIDEVPALLGVSVSKASPHGADHKLDHDIPDTAAVMNALGAEFTCYDVKPSRGMEIVADLNDELALGPADLVLDPGTTEHCANVGQAFKNAANAVSVGGVIFHCSPASMVNHGFFNICPTFLWDFYAQNGWNVLHISTSDRAGRGEPTPVAGTDRITLPSNSVINFLAQRRTSAPMRWPTQTRYL